MGKQKSGQKTRSNALTNLFAEASPCVLGFISKLSRLPAGIPPLYPQIFGTGFFVDKEGIAITNRHVVNAFEQVPTHPTPGCGMP